MVVRYRDMVLMVFYTNTQSGRYKGENRDKNNNLDEVCKFDFDFYFSNISNNALDREKIKHSESHHAP